MVTRMKVKSIIKTCAACPSQWEGHLEDGRMFYIRYRWGWLTAEVSNKPTNNVSDAIRVGPPVFESEIGETGWEGDMSTCEMKDRIKDVFDFSECEKISESA